MINLKYNFNFNIIAGLSLLAVLMLGFASVAQASSVVRTGDSVSIFEDQVINGDLYSAAGKVNVSGTIEEDLVSASGQITLGGSVGGDALLMSGQVDVHGTIGDDLRILSGEVTIAEPVMGDVFVLGGVVNILSTASVAGDVVLFAGEATIEGSVGGDVFGTVDNLRIDGQVAGNVDVKVGQLTLGDRAAVEGSVFYVSNTLVNRAQNASVGGELVRNDPVLPLAESNIRSAVIPMLVLLFSVLVWYWVSRRSLQKVVERALIKSPRPFLFGFLTLIFAPFAISLLMVSMIGVMVGLVALFGYLLLLTLGLVGISAVIGQLLILAFNQPSKYVSLMTLAIGVIGVAALLMLPIVGHVVLVGFMMITLGSMVDLLVRPNLD